MDDVIRQAGIPGAFIRTGNFYENMILRKYASYDPGTGTIKMSRPIITDKAESKQENILAALEYGINGNSHHLIR